MNINNEKTFTYELTNDVLHIVGKDGVLAVAINCTTVTSGQVVGDTAFGIDGKTSQPLTISKGTPITISASNTMGRLSDITITAPLNCTLQIIVQR